MELHKGKIRTNAQSKLPLLKVEVGVGRNLVETMSLLDTGCSSVVCSKQFYDNLRRVKGAYPLEDWEGKVLTANEGELNVCGSTTLKVRIDALTWKVEVLVVDKIKWDLIIGAPFISHTGMVIDLKEKCFSFKFSPKRVSSLEVQPKGEESQGEITVGCEDMRSKIEELVSKYSKVFTPKIGKALDYQVKLKLKSEEPVKLKPYFMSPPVVHKVREILADWESQDIIEPAISPYSAPCFLVKGERLVINYSKVNQQIEPVHFPMGDLQNMYGHLSNARYFSVIDLRSSFLQICLDPESRPITAFSTYFGSWQFKRVSFGLNVGSSVLCAYLDKLFNHIKFKFLINFADDLLVFSKSKHEHLEHLETVLKILSDNNLTANISKAKFCTTEISFLGSLVSNNTIRVDPKRTESILNFKRPRTPKQVSQFLGAVGFFSKFIEGYATLAQPLNELRKKRAKFVWSSECEASFEKLKQRIANPPVLQIPDWKRPFTLMSDASSVACGACLLQEREGELLPVAYYSKKFTSAELRYSVYEKEALSCILAIEKYHEYLEIQPFTLITDNMALSYVLGHKRKMGRLGRWVERLLTLPFRVEHRPGKDNCVADALSRMFSSESEEEVESSEEAASCEAARAPRGEDVASIRRERGRNKRRARWHGKANRSGRTHGLKELEGEQEGREVNSLLADVPLVYTDLSKHQSEDPECNEIMRSVRANTNHEGYYIKNSLLMFKKGDQRKGRIYLPRSLDSLIYRYFHESLVAGHMGALRTFKKISEYFYRKDLEQVIRAKVKDCLICKMCKPAARQYEGKLVSSYSENAMDKVFCDLIGPLPITRNRNVYVLLTLDQFSKFVWLSPLKSGKASQIISKLEQVVFNNFSAPRVLVSDNAMCFRSLEFKKFLFKYHVEHHRIAPYKASGNSAERYIQEVGKVLRSAYHDTQTQWDVGLNYVQHCLNTAYSESTKTTAHNLMFMHKHNCPLSNIWKLNDLVDHKLSAEEIKNNLSQAVKNVRLSISRNRKRERFGERRSQHPFKLGSIVLLKTHFLSKKADKFMSKLAPKYKGLYRIVHFITPVTCLLQDTEKLTEICKAHISQLKLYK